jgi:hypothetical protein
MGHMQSTPHPLELMSDDEDDEHDDKFRSEILAIFRLSTVPGWVYVAIAGDKEVQLYYDIQYLIKECRVVVRKDTALMM